MSKLIFQAVRIIEPDEFIGQVKQILRRTIVVHEHYFFCLRVILFKFKHVAYRRATEFINTLVVVRHDHHIIFRRREQFNQFILRPVGILKFVHQNVFIPSAMVFQNFRPLAKEPQSIID